MSTLALNKLTASFRGDPNNSTGEDVAKAVNAIIDQLVSQAESAEVTVNLESAADTLIDARKAWQLDPEAIIAMGERNQLVLEKALGVRDAAGNLVSAKSLNSGFNVVMGRGYFPITGNLLLPPGSGIFKGQGSFIRRKQIPDVLDSIEEYATALCPVGSTNELEPNRKSGILQQSGASEIGNFAVLGIFKNEWDGGNGLVTGHTPPYPMADPNTPRTDRKYWAAQPNMFTQDRFAKPHVWSDLTSFTLDNGNGDSEIVVPARGDYNVPQDVLPDDSVDIPLVRWVRAFNAQGTEILTKLNVSSGIKGVSVSISAGQGQIACSGKPPRDENGVVDPTFTKIYHKLMQDGDTTTTVVVPGGLPAETASVEVSFYHLKKETTLETEMTPYIIGDYHVSARSSYTKFTNIVSDGMPWNGFVLVDGAYNTFELCMARNNQMDGWYMPGGYEDLMHVNFTTCAAVNNKGWGCYLGEAFKTSMGKGDQHLWPDPVTGDLILHKKYTYTASCNNLGNFDTFGNTGGAYYIGGASNASVGLNCEHHFDTNNYDPFGNSAHKADINPCRWQAIVCITPRAFQNDLKFNTTSTDSRRMLLCKQRKVEETPDSGFGPDGNIYSAMTKNSITLPSIDDSGWLTQVNSPGFHYLNLTPWREHYRQAGDIESTTKGNLLNIRGMFCDTGQYLFHPWAEEKLNYDPTSSTKGARYNMLMRFSANHAQTRKDAMTLGIAADSVGWNNQVHEHIVKYGVGSVDMSGETLTAAKIVENPTDPALLPVLQPASIKKFSVSLGVIGSENPWFPIFKEGLDRMSLSIVQLNQDRTEVGTGYSKNGPVAGGDSDIDPGGMFDDEIFINMAKIDPIINGNGDLVLNAWITMVNLGDTDITWDPAVPAKHYFRWNLRIASSDATFPEIEAGQRWANRSSDPYKDIYTIQDAADPHFHYPR